MDSLHLGYEAGRVPVLYYDMVWMARAYYDGDIPVTWILAHEPPTRIQ